LIDLLSSVISGDRAAATTLARSNADEVVRVAEFHGVLPLVADRWLAWPDLRGPIADRLFEASRRYAARDLAREVALRELNGAFARDRVDVLLMKGAQLAYSHYPRPDLRPRADTDLLVDSDGYRRAHQTLLSVGYTAPGQVSGRFVSHQSLYSRRHDGVLVHDVDLHRRIANPQLFADLLSFDELRQSAVAMPSLHPAAHGLANPHALFLACVHRVAHHYDDDCLIWLHDIHLVASAMTMGEWERLVDLASRRHVVTICRQGLTKAAPHFGTVVPASVMTDQRFQVREDQAEPTASFLIRRRAQLENLASDLRTLDSWGNRWRLIREHLFPPRRYMREVYAPSSRAPLAMLYAWRAMRGARKWLVRP